MLSVDECLIKIIFGRIFVASRKLCRVTSFLNDMQCKEVFSFNNNFSTKDGWWFGCSQIHGKHRGMLLLDRVFRC